jgi:hypothetical protein
VSGVGEGNDEPSQSFLCLPTDYVVQRGGTTGPLPYDGAKLHSTIPLFFFSIIACWVGILFFQLSFGVVYFYTLMAAPFVHTFFGVGELVKGSFFSSFPALNIWRIRSISRNRRFYSVD